MLSEHFFNLLPSIVLIFVIIGNIECMFLHLRYGGKLKRGVKIWSELLSKDMTNFLRRLPGDFVDEETGAFIRKENNTVLIKHQHTKNIRLWLNRSALLYVAYIDLRVKKPRIQYRIPISTFLFLSTFIAIGAWIGYQQPSALVMLGLVLVILLAVYFDQRERIMRLITKAMYAQKQTPSPVHW